MAQPPAKSDPAVRATSRRAEGRRAAHEAVTRKARPSTDMSGFLRSGMAALVALAWGAACSAPADHHHPFAQDGPPAITGNPAADPTLPPRLGRPGVFMVHDGKGVKDGDAYRIDQSVNMGVLFLRTAGSGLRAILDVFAEENGGVPGEGAGRPLGEYSCRWTEEGRRLSSQREHVRAQPNSGATPPSHWYRESDRTVLACLGSSTDGTYRFELRGSKSWPGHVGFLVVRPLPVVCQ